MTNVVSLDKMFERCKDDIAKDLKHVLTHKSEELWQTNKPKRLQERVEKILRRVMYCLQPAVSSNISCFDLNGDDKLTDAILRRVYYGNLYFFLISNNSIQDYFCILARKKYIDDSDTKRRDYDENKQTTGTSNAKEAQMTSDEDFSKKRDDDRTLHDKQMLTLALQWNCLEVAKELIVRGSIENIKVIIKKRKQI
jgi:hypothetical protein